MLIASFLVSSSHDDETFVKENRWFLGGAIVVRSSPRLRYGRGASFIAAPTSGFLPHGQIMEKMYTLRFFFFLFVYPPVDGEKK